MATIYERAIEFIREGDVVGLGSGRASTEFIKLLGARVKAGFKVRGVPTSEASDQLARQLGIPLLTVEEGMPIAVTVDGADECDPNLDLIKGYGRALIREKVVAAASKKLVILVGPGKEVPILGTHGKLPVEVVPFALPVCRERLKALNCDPILWSEGAQPKKTDNGNYILDCKIGPLIDAARFEAAAEAIPGVVGTGLFLGMASVVLVGDDNFNLTAEKTRPS
jgi:ribose 5-phosphate isomerase A